MANSLDIVSAILLADAGVAALVADRVYPVLAPQNSVLPNIVITQISDNDQMLLSGAAELPESRVSVVSRGRDATEMMNVADAVKLALRNIIHQSVGGSPPLSEDVCVYKTAVDITSVFDGPISYEQSVDYMVRWRE